MSVHTMARFKRFKSLMLVWFSLN